MNTTRTISIFILGCLLLATACIDLVEDGIEVDYDQSSASLAVTAIGNEQAAIGEIISYSIQVSSPVNIKSCIVQSTNPGRNGSGFNIKTEGFDDPFADHNFGTIKKGIKSFKVRYDYIIPDDISKSRLTFTIIDEIGKVSSEKTLEVVPSIELYEDLSLYAKDETFNDAFASINGSVYPDIKTNYSIVSEASRTVQENIDILFFYDANSKKTVLAGPASGSINLELSIENRTLFKKLNDLSGLDLETVNPAFLDDIMNNEELLADGKTQVSGIAVGDVVGFITDLNAIHSLKTGLVKVTGLHPATVDHYQGLVYVLECDIVVQK